MNTTIVLTNKGEALLNLNEYSSALNQCFSKVKDVDYKRIFYCLNRMKKSDEIIKYCKFLLSNGHFNAKELLLENVQAFMTENNYHDALKLIDIADNSGFDEIIYYKLICLFQMKSYEKALSFIYKTLRETRQPTSQLKIALLNFIVLCLNKRHVLSHYDLSVCCERGNKNFSQFVDLIEKEKNYQKTLSYLFFC